MECVGAIRWDDPAIVGAVAAAITAGIFAIVIAGAVAALPAPGLEMSWATSGTGGLILWPLFGATNQLLGGLSFLVITFYLWRRKKPIWFVAIPLVFMLIMPAVAMAMQLPDWITAKDKNWTVIIIAISTLALEAWMIVEAVILVRVVVIIFVVVMPMMMIGTRFDEEIVAKSAAGEDVGVVAELAVDQVVVHAAFEHVVAADLEHVVAADR